jgi:Co/Zn/Cd efflux system component
MFVIELLGAQKAGSASLLADAVDFLGDAANYAVSLFALALGALWRARTALMKGFTMGLYGIAVLAKVAWAMFHGAAPHATTMGVVGAAALAANLGVAALLFTFREGDANMRSVWLCSRNDAIGNVAVIVAAAVVSATSSRWPDLLVALAMSALALSAARSVIRQARTEIADIRRPALAVGSGVR